jgi:hypothetical protein
MGMTAFPLDGHSNGSNKSNFRLRHNWIDAIVIGPEVEDSDQPVATAKDLT